MKHFFPGFSSCNELLEYLCLKPSVILIQCCIRCTPRQDDHHQVWYKGLKTGMKEGFCEAWHHLFVCHAYPCIIALSTLMTWLQMNLSFDERPLFFIITGTSGLHLSIAYRNGELIELLLQSGANIHQRASGNFFMPSDQQAKRDLRRPTNFSGENEWETRRKKASLSKSRDSFTSVSKGTNFP